MGWIKRNEPQFICEHPKQPRLHSRWGQRLLAEPGDLWKCDDCGTVFEVVRSRGWSSDPYSLEWVYRKPQVKGRR